MKLLRKALTDGYYLLDVDAHDFPAVFRETVAHLVEKGVVDVDHRDEVETALLKREQLGSTAIGHAVAVPHAYLDGIAEPTIVFVRLANPINLGAPDGISTHFVFVLARSTRSGGGASRHAHDHRPAHGRRGVSLRSGRGARHATLAQCPGPFHGTHVACR